MHAAAVVPELVPGPLSIRVRGVSLRQRSVSMAARATNLGELTGFAADVRAGLTKDGQKELASKYLYDEVGSKLFEVISVLPEYGLTRADERLLRRHARDLAALLPAGTLVAELGSGTGTK